MSDEQVLELEEKLRALEAQEIKSTQEKCRLKYKINGLEEEVADFKRGLEIRRENTYWTPYYDE